MTITRRSAITRRSFLSTVGGGALLAASGTRPGRAAAAPPARQVDATPSAAKAIYMNPLITTEPDEFFRLVDMIERTELNALVVDVKEQGVYYPTEVALFQEIDAVRPILDVAGLLRTLNERGIAAIARLVTFRDDAVAENRPDLAVADTGGGVWRDMNGGAWGNPFAPELRAANIELAVELASLGFDEIQFDYVRFPTDGDLSTMDFGQPVDESTRVEAIASFLGQAREQLAPLGARTAADVFGYILLDDNIGIGQNVAALAPAVDLLCPMVYPSHFPNGSINVPGHPNDFPGETIAISMASGADKLNGEASKLRPWLQDFTLGTMSEYGAAAVRAQIDAADAAGTSGWMIWDPNNIYHEAAFAPAG